MVLRSGFLLLSVVVGGVAFGQTDPLAQVKADAQQALAGAAQTSNGVGGLHQVMVIDFYNHFNQGFDNSEFQAQLANKQLELGESDAAIAGIYKPASELPIKPGTSPPRNYSLLEQAEYLTQNSANNPSNYENAMTAWLGIQAIALLAKNAAEANYQASLGIQCEEDSAYEMWQYAGYPYQGY